MLKQVVQYEDYNGVSRTEELYFNITRMEFIDNIDLEQEIRKIDSMSEGDKRELVPQEIKLILNLVKRLIKMAYGVRSEDGRHFRKNNEVWDDFVDSAAYDAFLEGLFLEPNKALDFMTGILPKDIRDEAMAQARAQGLDVPGEVVEPPAEKDIREMSREELLAAMQRKNES